jgi:membrane associated rhomboid family serine protease
LFPLRDENPAELTPYVTVILIAVNVGIWVYYQGAGLNEALLVQSVCGFGMIPADVTGQAPRLLPGVGAPCPLGGLSWQTLFTSMFLHGSWLHLIGNMWFLWLFGNNVEDSMGHLRFVVFYLLAGVAGGGAHIWSTPDSVIPTVGASGAISGVMGAYLVLYPRVRIHTLFIIIFFIKIIPISAWLVLLYWFAIQLFSGTTAAAAGAGVAFWAHIGGFVAGVLLIKLFENRTLVDAKRRKIKLSPWEIEGRGWR